MAKWDVCKQRWHYQSPNCHQNDSQTLVRVDHVDMERSSGISKPPSFWDCMILREQKGLRLGSQFEKLFQLLVGTFSLFAATLQKPGFRSGEGVVGDCCRFLDNKPSLKTNSKLAPENWWHGSWKTSFPWAKGHLSRGFCLLVSRARISSDNSCLIFQQRWNLQS